MVRKHLPWTAAVAAGLTVALSGCSTIGSTETPAAQTSGSTAASVAAADMPQPQLGAGSLQNVPVFTDFLKV